MRIVIAVDWSEQALAAVRHAFALYMPQQVTLVHGADLGPFQYPIVAQAANLQGYDDFRKSMLDAGRQVLEQAATMVPREVSSVTKICEIAKPAGLVLDTATSTGADLLVVGARGRGRVTELVLGSVSHRIVLHAPCATLVCKGEAHPPKRILVAVEGYEDGERLSAWLSAHPFKTPVDLTVLTVILPMPVTETFSMLPVQAWTDAAMLYAEDLVKRSAKSLMGPSRSVSTQALSGDPTETVASQAEGYDLLVVGSHGRKGLERFLLGSVSHALVHRAPCSVLVVR